MRDLDLVVRDYKENEPQIAEFTCEGSELEIDFHDMKFIQPVNISGTVELFSSTLRYHGDIKTEVERECGRTLKTVNEALSIPFDLVFEVKNVELVSISEQVRELLILEHPMVYRAPDTEFEDQEESKEEGFTSNPFSILKEKKMAHPKRRQSHSRTHKRRGQDEVGTMPAVSRDKQTGEFTTRHRVAADGTYRGRQVLTVKVKSKDNK